MKWITATFPNLHIHGVAQFQKGVFRSTDPQVIARMAPWVGRYGVTQVSEDTDPPDLPLRDPWPGAVLDIELFGEDGKVRESVLPPRLSDVELRAASEAVAVKIAAKRAQAVRFDAVGPTNVVRYPAAINAARTQMVSYQAAAFAVTSDDTDTWTVVHTFTNPVRAARYLDNGEVIVSTRSTDNLQPHELWLSSGWSANPATAIWTKVMTGQTAGNGPTNDWSWAVHGPLIACADYGTKGGADNARHAYLTEDYGQTWRVIYDLGTTVGNHLHGVIYDAAWDRIWLTYGDDTSGIVYSDDRGATWKTAQSAPGANDPNQVVGGIALPNCILFGTDGYPNGVLRIPRSQGKSAGTYTLETAYKFNDTNAITHLCHGVYQAPVDNAPIVFGFSPEITSGTSRVLVTYDGYEFAQVWEDPVSTPAGRGLQVALGPTALGNLVLNANDARYGTGMTRWRGPLREQVDVNLEHRQLEGPSTHPAVFDAIRRGKGGSIGTEGKGVVAFRFDHYIDTLLATVWPLFTARALPGGVGIISRPGNTVDPTSATWAQVKAMIAQGNEVWSHSATHGDPGTTLAGLVDEIVNAKTEIEAQSLRVMGWQMAGTPTTNPDYGSNFQSVAKFKSPVGRLLLAHYALIECYAGGSRRMLPSHGCYGLDHITVETLTLANLKSRVDEVVNRGVGIEFMIHANRMGAPGFITLADFTAFLDYVVSKRDAGQLEVLTPSGLAFADPSHSRRLDLLYAGGFEGLTTAAPGPWNMPAGATINTDGGFEGSNYLRITSTGASVGQGNGLITPLGLGGMAFEVRGKFRAPVAAATARITAVDNTVPATPVTIRQVDYPLTAGLTWQPFRFSFVMPVATDTFKLELRRLTTGSDVDFDDLSVRAV